MIPHSPFWDQLFLTVGEITIILIVGSLLLSFIIVAVALYSIKKGKFYFPKLMTSGLVFMEGGVKAVCKLLGLEDSELVTFFIKLHNRINAPDFANVPVEKRAIFIPQCLRNSRCPAHLTPEGLVCRRCGRCEIGDSIDILEDMGYRVCIVPGSTFIKRIAKKYRPQAIIGIGCLMEIKEGLEMADRMDLIGMGVVTLKDGCVETLVNWNDVLDIAAIGLEDTSVSKDLDISSS